MIRALLSPILEPFALLWRRRALLAAAVRAELSARHAGSVLGPLWIALHPLLFLAVYAGLYLYVFRARTAALAPPDYALLMFGGLVPFLGFAEALATGTGSVAGNAHLVRNTLFPVELIPARAVLCAQATPLVGGLMLVAAALALGRATPHLLLLPLAWGSLLLFTLGAVWILASLHVVLRDLQSAVGILNLLLLAASPIAFTAEMLPAPLRPLVAWNPFALLIVAHQRCLLPGEVGGGAAQIVAAPLVALALFAAGFAFFRRMKGLFFDHA